MLMRPTHRKKGRLASGIDGMTTYIRTNICNVLGISPARMTVEFAPKRQTKTAAVHKESSNSSVGGFLPVKKNWGRLRESFRLMSHRWAHEFFHLIEGFRCDENMGNLEVTEQYLDVLRRNQPQ